MIKFRIVTPHAAVLIWNYTERSNADGVILSKLHNIEQVVIGTSSIISISTQKSKSSPSGKFEIRLAPRFNWVTRITPGSWCAILMSQDPIPTMSKDNQGKADPKSFKMLGRIDSVRGAVEVDQVTGARRTVYVVTGQDWGSVFETNMYIDPNIANNILKDNILGQAYSIIGLNMYASLSSKEALPSSSDLVNTLMYLWGTGYTGTAIVNGEELIAEELKPKTLLLSSKVQFQLPGAVARWMLQGKVLKGLLVAGTTSVEFSSIIQRQQGVLTGPDKYVGVKESFGVPDPSNFFGVHTLWQLLNDLCNPTLYELVNDIRWEDGVPKFTLYHRIKPFVTRNNFLSIMNTQLPLSGESKAVSEIPAAKSILNPIISLFKNVRKIEIPLNEVSSINFGTNWRDKINFIEVTPTSQLLPEGKSIAAKLDGQTIDQNSFGRDGFKPMFARTAFIPYDGGSTPNIDGLTKWKYLLREWYFNTHMMLNGSMTIVGQNQYIQVGDNVLVDSSVLGSAPMSSVPLTSIGTKIYLLAHVENISHNFAVNQETGARTFSTTIQFVRGIMTDKDGATIQFTPDENGAIDKDASTLPGEKERNTNVFGSSVVTDPDVQKLNKGTGIL